MDKSRATSPVINLMPPRHMSVSPSDQSNPLEIATLQQFTSSHKHARRWKLGTRLLFKIRETPGVTRALLRMLTNLLNASQSFDFWG